MSYNIDEIIKRAKTKQYEARYDGVPNVAPVTRVDESEDFIEVSLPGTESGIFDVPLDRVMEAVGGMAAMLAAIAKNADPRYPDGFVSDIDPQSALVRFSFDEIPFDTDDKLWDAMDFLRKSSVIVKRYRTITDDVDGLGGVVRNLVIEGSVDEINRFNRRLFMYI